MLKALYDYAQRHQLAPPVGYVKKTVKAYILLSAEGRFLGIEMGGTEAVAAPDIGSLANGKDKSNILVEKRSVVLPDQPSEKSLFFLNALKDGGKADPKLLLCANALEDAETVQAIRAKLDQDKVKAADRISFRVDGVSIFEGDAVLNWWKAYRRSFSKNADREQVLCLITGEKTTPVATTPPIQGLYAVGGHGRGDALICFDKNAFCSYDLKQAANAPVSEEAYAGVKAGLDALLERAPVLAGMKFVHWYDRELKPEEDIIANNANLWGDFLDDDEDTEPDTEESLEETERSARKAADALIQSIQSGEQRPALDDVSYYILLLTGVNGRIMIRRYERGRYQELQKQLQKWHSDLELINSRGTAPIKPVKLTARLLRLMSYQQNESRPFERLGKELSGITPAVLTSILTGCPLPDTIAARALAHIRSVMLSEEERKSRHIGLACQWLKVWLLRSKHKGDVLMNKYNPEYHSNAYYCGAMMAVYERIQQAAMPDVNASVMQRFYASAIQTPALVLGRLSRMSIHHLEKLDRPRLAQHFKEHLQQIASQMTGTMPTTLSLEEQSEFALGYYQMGAKLSKEAIDRAAANQANESKQTNESEEE